MSESSVKSINRRKTRSESTNSLTTNSVTNSKRLKVEHDEDSNHTNVKENGFPPVSNNTVNIKKETDPYEIPKDDDKDTSLATFLAQPAVDLVKPFINMCCQQCRINRVPHQLNPFGDLSLLGYCQEQNTILSFNAGDNLDSKDGENNQMDIIATSDKKSPFKIVNMPPSYEQSVIQTILNEYLAAAKFYGCNTINAGVLTTFRFSLPTLRVSGSFHDADLLALSEVLLRHCNGALRHIRRLDFSVASKEGKLHGKPGFRSHGAFTLSKILLTSKFVEEVFLQRNLVGPYGATALFMSMSKNTALKTIIMRRCSIGERGALAFAHHVLGPQSLCTLKEVDLSVNKIGFKGILAIESAIQHQKEKSGKKMEVDLEGNLVFQEVMNGITHGVGFILCIIGAVSLSYRVKDMPSNYVISCAVYSLSLLALYISSTLYHSFFALTTTRFVFGVMDQCAIYILIAGSYTPFLCISLEEYVLGSVYLLSFIWISCICGILVEAIFPYWEYKTRFSLTMYLFMGWSVLICIPALIKILPGKAMNLLILGGVAYTSGVPFFVRNNNLDHSIWHLFVLTGSLLHWICVFMYVAKKPT